MKEHQFDCIYDALGGGPVTDLLICKALPKTRYFAYGALEGKKLEVSSILPLFSGINITGFSLMPWWIGVASQEKRQEIREKYSERLLKELSSTSCKELKFEELLEGIELSTTKATDGKVLIKVQ